ncbi:MAG: potassium-transporting ATPase subunit KdpA [Parachlamydiaceae bacterium]|nr:potassium-transporting ATPase subunit KdpA [Parachlamydiaceae bacterium]
MSSHNSHNLYWIQPLLFLILLGCTPLLGRYLNAIFQGHRTFMHSILGWLEKLTYPLAGIDSSREMNWKEYLKALLAFNFIGLVVLFALQLFQYSLPLNPQQLPDVPWTLAFNTALSFVTNTNWQSYAGETTLSYHTQLLGLTVQNFLSAATGMAVLLALIRGIVCKETCDLGNFWVDITRTIVYVLIPFSLVIALLLVSQGVIQNFSSYVTVTTLENASQTIPMGPVASQVAIKQLGTNGGGFFNTNSAHPFENPNGISNLIEVVSIMLLPVALVFMYGYMAHSKRHGHLLVAVMAFFWALGLAISIYSEHIQSPLLDAFPILEGKETRFGITNSVLWSTSTTATANGSVNSMLSSLSPLAGGVALFNMMLGEHFFGGIGVGLASMIIYILLTVFLSGLMVGRTPEYMGKKIEKREVQWVIFSVLMPCTLVLIGSSIALLIPNALNSLSHKGPHGLTELLYAFTSAASNNGSSFAGLDANTPFYNLALGLTILLGRTAVILPALAIAGSLAQKKSIPKSLGTFSTSSWLFVFLLVCVILIVGALSFFPAVTLGPITEHLLMLKGRGF